MRNIILGFVLVIAGIFGALIYSAVFFGFFTVGLFLILTHLIAKSSPAESLPSQTLSTSIAGATSKTCLNCGKEIDGMADFCAHCGNKVAKK